MARRERPGGGRARYRFRAALPRVLRPDDRRRKASTLACRRRLAAVTRSSSARTSAYWRRRSVSRHSVSRLAWPLYAAVLACFRPPPGHAASSTLRASNTLAGRAQSRLRRSERRQRTTTRPGPHRPGRTEMPPPGHDRFRASIYFRTQAPVLPVRSSTVARPRPGQLEALRLHGGPGGSRTRPRHGPRLGVLPHLPRSAQADHVLRAAA
jgi:hypothetical protein